jgi:hypothetical protein
MCEGVNMKNHDGVYLAFFTGEFGTSIGIFLFKGGVLVGADLGGGIYDGELDALQDSAVATGRVRFRSKEGLVSITGATSDYPIFLDIEVKLKLPLDTVPFQELQTPTGPVNVRFEKVRSL